MKKIIIPIIILMTACNTSDDGEAKYRISRSMDNPEEVIRDEDAFKKEGDLSDVMEIASQKPVYVGGKPEMYAFIKAHLVMPEAALKNKISGLVYVRFVIEKDGSISNAKVTKGLGYGTDEAAKEVIMKMPNWEPAKHKGQIVRVFKSLPILFDGRPLEER